MIFPFEVFLGTGFRRAMRCGTKGPSRQLVDLNQSYQTVKREEHHGTPEMDHTLLKPSVDKDNEEIAPGPQPSTGLYRNVSGKAPGGKTIHVYWKTAEC